MALSAALSVSVTRSTPLFTWSREFSWDSMAAVMILGENRRPPRFFLGRSKREYVDASKAVLLYVTHVLLLLLPVPAAICCLSPKAGGAVYIYSSSTSDTVNSPVGSVCVEWATPGLMVLACVQSSRGMRVVHGARHPRWFCFMRAGGCGPELTSCFSAAASSDI